MRCHSRSCYDPIFQDKKNKPFDLYAAIRRKSCEGELFGKLYSLRKQRLYLTKLEKKAELIKKVPPNLRRILITTKQRGSSQNIMKSHKTFTPLIKADLDFSTNQESPISMKSLVSSPLMQKHHTTLRTSIHYNAVNQPYKTSKVISPVISPHLSPTYRNITHFRSLHIDGPLLNKCKTTLCIKKKKKLPTLREFKHKHHI